MAQRLQIVIAIRSTLSTWHDVIDIGRGYHLFRVQVVGITTQRLTAQMREPRPLPHCAIATLMRCRPTVDR